MKTVLDFFLDNFKNYPNRIAIEKEKDKLTYQQLNELSDRVANNLIYYFNKSNNSKHLFIGLHMSRSPMMIVAMLGILKAKKAYVPLDPVYPTDRLANIIEDAKLNLIITDKNSKTMHLQTHCVSIDQLLKNNNIYINDDQKLTKKDPAYILYTSGTTGKPKGILICHENVSALISWAKRIYKYEGIQRVLASTSICFDLSVFEIFVTLSLGGTVILVDNALSLLNEYRNLSISLINTVPSAITELLKADAIPKNVKVINLAGEALSQNLVQQLYEKTKIKKLYNLYGPSEDTTYSTYFLADPESNHKMVPIGFAIDETEIIIVDDDDNELSSNKKGEILIAGKGLAQGYLNNDTLTNKKFVFLKKGKNKTRYYRTGDIGFFDNNNCLHYCGRKDYQVKIRGFRIELQEIEVVIRSFFKIEECIVVPYKDKGLLVSLVAFIQFKDSHKCSWNKLKSYILSKLPSYMLPSHFQEINSWPLNFNGKIDRNKLIEQINFSSNQPNDRNLIFQNDYQKQLYACWKKIFPDKKITLKSSFFDLGGHSLKAVRIFSYISRKWNVQLPITDILKLKTIEKIAKEISCKKKKAKKKIQLKEQTIFPLLFSQERIYMVQKLSKPKPCYFVPCLIKIEGTLNLKNLKNAIVSIIKKHPILRVKFKETHEGIYQKIESEFSKDIQVILAKEEQEIINIARKQIYDNWKQSNPTVFKATIFNLSPKINYLYMFFDHSCMDGWSLLLLMEELSYYYNKHDMEITEDFNYFYFCQIQKAYKKKWQQELLFWENEIDNSIDSLNLPYKTNLDIQKLYEGRIFYSTINKDLVLQLTHFAQLHDVSISTLLVAFYMLFLHRITQQDNIFIGFPVDGRFDPEMQSSVGLFMNTVPLFSTYNPNSTFSEFLNEIHNKLQKIKKNQSVPLDLIIDKLNISKDPLTQLPFQSIFTFLDSYSNNLDLKNLNSQQVLFDLNTSRAPLSLIAVGIDDQNTIELQWEYMKSHFDDYIIESLSNSFLSLLTSILQNKNLTNADYSIISKQTYENIRTKFNPNLNNLPKIEKILIQKFDEIANLYPNHIAIKDGFNNYTYKELQDISISLANALHAQIGNDEKFIGLSLPRSKDIIVGIIALFRLNLAYVPIDVDVPNKRKEYIIKDSKIKTILTHSSIRGKLPKSVKCICINEQKDNANTKISKQFSNVDNIAYIIYTSGSTGKPKGVLVSQECVIRLFDITHKWSKFNKNDSWTLFHSYAFDFSVWEMWGALLYGGKLVIVPFEISRSPAQYLSLCEKNNITIVNQTPSAFKNLLQAFNKDISWSPRMYIFGGEKLDPNLITQYFEQRSDNNISFVNMYGITETTVHTTYHFVKNKEIISNIGKPLDDLNIYILDRNKKFLPTGICGEIYVTGRGVTKGYLDKQEITKEKFLDNWLDNSQNKIYKTGDIGRYLEDGTIEYIGRIDSQIQLQGHRIELDEIIYYMKQIPNIQDSIVVVKNDILLAYYKSLKSINASYLKEQLKKMLPSYAIPQAYIFMDSFPINYNGKIETKNLPLPDEKSFPTKSQNIPMSVVEKEISKIYESILMHKNITVEDSFFDLGGNSMKLVILMNKLNEWLIIKKIEKKINIIDLFRYPSIKTFINHFINQDYYDNILREFEKGKVSSGKEIPKLKFNEYKPKTSNRKMKMLRRKK